MAVTKGLFLADWVLAIRWKYLDHNAGRFRLVQLIIKSYNF